MTGMMKMIKENRLNPDGQDKTDRNDEEKSWLIFPVII
jgi:hypothetical protein